MPVELYDIEKGQKLSAEELIRWRAIESSAWRIGHLWVGQFWNIITQEVKYLQVIGVQVINKNGYN